MQTQMPDSGMHLAASQSALMLTNVQRRRVYTHVLPRAQSLQAYQCYPGSLQEDPGGAAAELGLLDADANPERLLLFQLPSLLPVPASSLGPPKPGAPLRSLSQPTGSSLDQLPSGKVGVYLAAHAFSQRLGPVLQHNDGFLTAAGLLYVASNHQSAAAQLGSTVMVAVDGLLGGGIFDRHLWSVL